MQTVVVSENGPVGLRIRQCLLQGGLDCPTENRVSFDKADACIATTQPDLIIIVLSPDPPAALSVLERLHAQTPTKILAVGPGSDARLVLEAIRNGAADYIDVDNVEAELSAAVNRIRTEITPKGSGGKVIAVLGPNGGCGSSTVAVNLATLLAKKHNSSMLLDLKLENGDLAALLDVKPIHTLADVCRHLATLDRVMFERSLVKHESGVHLLAPPARIMDVKEVTTKGVEQVLQFGSRLHPYVVIDMDHSFREEQVLAFNHADEILLIMRLDFVSLRNCRRTLDYLQDIAIPRERVHVVVNRYGQPKELQASKVEEALGVKIAYYLPDDPKSINRANNNGVPVVLEAPSARVSKSLAQMAFSLNGRSNGRSR